MKLHDVKLQYCWVSSSTVESGLVSDGCGTRVQTWTSVMLLHRRAVHRRLVSTLLAASPVHVMKDTPATEQTVQVSQSLVPHFYTVYMYTVSQKKLGHFYFYCNFGKCWSIFKILSMSESERNGS